MIEIFRNAKSKWAVVLFCLMGTTFIGMIGHCDFIRMIQGFSCDNSSLLNDSLKIQNAFLQPTAAKEKKGREKGY